MKNTSKMLLATCALLLAFSTKSLATVHVVNNGGPGDFTSFSAAHTAAAVGDTIYFVGSQTSYGNLTLTKRLTLIGPGYYLDLNPNTNQNKMRAIIAYIYIQPALPLTEPTRDFDSGAAGSHIMGLEADNGINVYVNDVIIERCWAVNIIGQYFTAQAQYPANITVSRCFVQYYVQNMEQSLVQNTVMFQTGYDGVTQVRNSFVKNCIMYGATASENAGTAFRNTLFYGNASITASGQDPNNVKYCIFSAAAQATTGVGNLFSQSFTTMYISPAPAAPDAKYQLNASSIALNFGRADDDVTPIDAGAFGGLTPYVLSGLPSLPIVYEITAPNSVNAADGLPVTIKVKANN
jgi:hypothetical protein